MVQTEVIYGSILLFIAVSLAAAGGIGGGGLNLPILLVIFNYSLSRSVTLSLCAVLGSTICQFMLNYKSPHPVLNTRPLIYYDCVWILLPAQICGSIIGTKLRYMFPDQFVAGISLSVLLFAGYKTAVRYRLPPTSLFSVSRLFESTLQIEETVASNLSVPDPEMEVKLLTTKCSKIMLLRIQYYPVIHRILKTRRAAGTRHNPLDIPWPFIKSFGACWTCYVIINTLYLTMVDHCSVSFWVLFGFSFLPLLACLLIGIKTVRKAQIEDYSYSLPGDLDFKEYAMPGVIVASCVGAIGTLIGIGGGILMAPFLFSLGVLPNISSATTALMSLITSISVIIQYLAQGELSADIACWNIFVGFAGGFTGRKFVIFLVKEYKRESIIILFVLVSIILSIATLLYGISEMSGGFSFETYCK